MRGENFAVDKILLMEDVGPEKEESLSTVFRGILHLLIKAVTNVNHMCSQ